MKRWLRGLTPIHNSIPHGVTPPDSTWAFIWFFIRQAKGAIALFLIAEALAALSQLIVPVLIAKVVGAFSNGSIHNEIQQPHFWGVVAFALLFRPLVMMAYHYVIGNAFRPYFANVVRKQMHEYTLRQSLSFFQNDFAGRIASKLQEVGTAIRSGVETAIGTVLYAIMVFIGALSLISTIHWSLVCILLAWIIAYIIIAKTLLPKVRKYAAEAAHTHSTSLGHRVDVYTHIPAVKLNGAEEVEMKTDLFNIYEQNDANQRLESKNFQVRACIETSNATLLISIFFTCLWLHLQDRLNAADAALTLTLVAQLLNMSGWVMHNIGALAENYGKIADAVSTLVKPLTVQNHPDAAPLQVTNGAIEMHHATYQYGRGIGGMVNINLQIKAGERIGVIGASGAGKSTLVAGLARYFDLENGSILIDGQNIAKVTQQSLRQAMGVVTQEPEIFHRSIRANIAYGKHEATEEEIIAAAKAAHAHDFILNLQDPQGRKGYDAVVGERGIRLSGGQRQRITIARTLLANRPILILDEATSALDSESEAAIQENLGLLMQGRTVIAIAHRLSTLKAMDRIIVMDEGTIAEQGTHQQLLAKDGIYAKLWNLQTGGFLPIEAA